MPNFVTRISPGGRSQLLEQTQDDPADRPIVSKNSVLEVFLAELRLGLTSFGGPIAHLGGFHDEYIARRKWMDEESYADTVAFAQSIPGATSSEVGIILGTHRAGLLGGVAAWLGFTMPSALVLILFGYTLQFFSGNIANASCLHGLKIAAVVIVAQAVLGMGWTLAPDRERASIAIGSAIAAMAVEGIAIGQVVIIGAAGLVGWLFLQKPTVKLTRGSIATHIPRPVSVAALILFFTYLSPQGG